MKSKIYKLLIGAKQGLFALTLTVFASTAFAQNTYTFNFTGGQQTISLQPGTYTLEAWGADGGDNMGNGSTTFSQNGGRGGYAMGVYTIASTTTLFVNVGGRGSNSTSSLNVTAPGGYNGGGYGSANTASGKSSGAGGGGASHVATASGTLGALSTNTTAVRIVAGGGGGAGESNYANTNTAYNSNGGNGGGISGLQNATTSYLGRNGQGGTQTAGGGGGDNGTAIAGPPLQGIFGAGGFNTTANGNTSAGGSGAGGGGGGWYGGGAGWVGATGFQAGAGGGGSGYIGGVMSGTSIVFGQSSFVTNPVASTGNGLVLIKELCSITLSNNVTGNNNVSICAGTSLTLTTNAISNYSWSNSSSASSIVVTPTASTAYTLTATSPSNCTTSRVILVTVSAGIPTLSINSSTNNVCLGLPVSFTATGANTYTWSNGLTNGGIFTPSITSGYTVLGQNGCGTSSAVTSVTISPLAVSLISNPTVVCAGSTSTLTAAAAANSYSWFPVLSTTGSSLIVSPQVNTIYTVTASNGTCLGTSTVAVNALPVPTISALPIFTTVCSGVGVNLNASGANSYTWTPGNLSGSSITVTPNQPTQYLVVGTSSNGCISSANVAVLTNASPTINLSANNSLICNGDLVTISAIGASTYTWNNGANTSTLQVTPAISTIYTITGTTNSCSASETIAISVFIPSLSISGNTSVCLGETASITASGANTYLWSNGFTSPGIQVTPNSTTLYTLTALSSSSGINCPVNGSVQVLVKAIPSLTVTSSRNQMCKGESNTIFVTGANTYTWSTGTSASSIVISPTLISTVQFSVTGTSSLNCSNTETISIKVNACNGIEKNLISENVLAVYPNPNNGNFTIKSNEKLKVIVLNELGQTIRITELNDENNFVNNLFDLPSGIFFVIGQNQNQKIVTKIIVTK
jgi:hypothetical protein